MIGVDAAIDFPVRRRLVEICKALRPPADLANHLNHRRDILKKIVSSHGDAGSHYLPFLDHDFNERFHYSPFAGQTKVALTCLMTLQGIPCIYYGTEQGLDGRGDRREYVREALWGKPNAFSDDHEIYQLIRRLSELRNQKPALRYGRQYFRPCSGNGIDFGFSPYKGGILAYSRILNDREVLIVANNSVDQESTVHVLVDANLNPSGRLWEIAFSTKDRTGQSTTTVTNERVHCVQLTLEPMEAQVLTHSWTFTGAVDGGKIQIGRASWRERV